MSIPLDQYFIVTPGSEFISKNYATLSGTDLFLYITETGSLRVVNMNSTISPPNAQPGTTTFSLAQNAKWVGSISRPGIVHIYFADTNGQMKYIPYTLLGGSVIVQSLSMASVITFSVTYAPQTTPPAYMIMTDDGINHNLFVATDPAFHSVISSVRTYSNLVNPATYVTRPAIAMHPLDATRITVHCQQFTVLTSVSRVGFYVVKVLGLT